VQRQTATGRVSLVGCWKISEDHASQRTVFAFPTLWILRDPPPETAGCENTVHPLVRWDDRGLPIPKSSNSRLRSSHLLRSGAHSALPAGSIQCPWRQRSCTVDPGNRGVRLMREAVTTTVRLLPNKTDDALWRHSTSMTSVPCHSQREDAHVLDHCRGIVTLSLNPGLRVDSAQTTGTQSATSPLTGPGHCAQSNPTQFSEILATKQLTRSPDFTVSTGTVVGRLRLR
jgi:hypothetical protein